MLTPVDLELIFGVPHLERGRRFLSEGRVVDAQVLGADRVRGKVHDADGRTREVEVVLRRDRHGVDVGTTCSCAGVGNCEHAAAVLCRVLQSNGNGAASDETSDQWLTDLEDLVAQSVTSGDDASPAARIAYVVSLEGDEVQSLHVRTLAVREGSAPRPFAPADVLHSSEEVCLEHADRAILYELAELGYRPQQGLALDGMLGAALFERMVDTGRCRLQRATGQVLMRGEPRSLVLDWTLDGESGCFSVNLQTQPPCTRVLDFVPPWFIDARTALSGPIDTALPRAVSDELACAPSVEPQAVPGLMRRLEGSLAPLGVRVAPPPRIEHLPTPPCVPVLTLSAAAHDAEGQARLCFEYAGFRLFAGHASGRLVRRDGERFVVLERSPDAEAAAGRALQAAGLAAAPHEGDGAPALEWRLQGSVASWPTFMVDGLAALLAAGWRVEYEEGFPWRLVADEPWSVTVRANRATLELDLRAPRAELALLAPLVSALAAEGGDAIASGAIVLGDGAVVPAPARRVTRVAQVLAELGADLEAIGGGARLSASRFAAATLLALDAPELGLTLDGDVEVLALGRRIAAFKGIRDLPAPPGLGVELRGYQRQALGWFGFLADIGSGGCLADDMGLGKTVQTLAHLLVEKVAGRADRPSLVVAPTSVLGNWMREAKRVAPALRVLLLHGPQRHASFDSIGEHDLCVTSYALLPRDEEHLRRHAFHLVILDEAQNIKNPRTRAAVVTRRIEARRTLALTGTPLENHLGELWALFSVLVPGLLGSEAAFRRTFRRPIERDGDVERARLLAKRLAPFMLRRTKAGVAPELPPRTELIHTVPLAPAQARVYEHVREDMERRLKLMLRSRTVEESRVEVLSALLRLRQACCDPRLLGESGTVEDSAKLSLLLELVEELVAADHRTLVFSQFTSMLALIGEALTAAEIDYIELTGETRDRQSLIDRFQTGAVPVFLVSLKAGGTGLNLTAADTVIHFDPWWNPAAQEQASDRAHRIGQTQPVFVHKLLTEGTVEERIHALQAHKQRLADGLFEGRGRTGLEWTAEQLEELLAPMSDDAGR